VNRKQILHLSRLQAALQFAPQISTLKHQAGQSNAALATGIAAQAAAARAIADSAHAARRPMKRTFDQELHSNASVNKGVAADLASLGPGADRFRGAADREAALATENTTSARTHAEQGLSNLATNAAKGRAFAVLNLLSQHNQDISGINQKINELQGQKGAAATKGFLSLLNQEESHATARGSLRERTRHDKAMEQNAASKGGGKGSYSSKHGGFSQAEVLSATSKAKDGIREAQKWLERGTPEGLLSTGGKVPHNQPILDPATGKPQVDSQGQVKVQRLTITVPKIPAILIRAAKELRSIGRLSPGTVHELRTRAVSVPKPWLPHADVGVVGRPPGQRPT
jgi:hypothetical protein